MKRTVSYEIPFERESGLSNWTLLITREPDCPFVTFGLIWGDKLTFTHAKDEPIEDVLNMLKELTDAGV
jgi:hypothetical protein